MSTSLLKRSILVALLCPAAQVPDWAQNVMSRNFNDMGMRTSPWTSGRPAVESSNDHEMQPWAPWVVPLESTSTYAAHYQPWRTSRTTTCKPKNERLPQAAFNARSTAQDSFMPWDRDHRRESCKPPHKTISDNVFEPSTSHREAYRAWNIAKQPSYKPAMNRLEPHKFVGRSTSQDSYMGHDGHMPPSPFLPPENINTHTPFESISTMSASYLPWPMQRNSGAVKPSSQLDLGADPNLPTGTTVHRDAFTEIRLPPGCKAALGVQVTPGNFHLMIPKGSAAPSEKKHMFTTTVNNQEVIEVVVIALADDHASPFSGLELGRFNVGRIQQARIGTLQLDVTMYLGLDQSVRVSAHNRQSDQTISLNIRDKFRTAKF